MAWYNPTDWTWEGTKENAQRAGLAWATGGLSEAYGFKTGYDVAKSDEVGGAIKSQTGLDIGGGLDAITNFATSSLDAAFPGAVDPVNQNVPVDPMTQQAILDTLGTGSTYAGASTGTGAMAQQNANDLLAGTNYNTGVAQNRASLISNDAYAKAIADANVLGNMGTSAYSQGLSDQAQLELMGSTFAQSGSQNAANISNLSQQYAGDIGQIGELYAPYLMNTGQQQGNYVGDLGGDLANMQLQGGAQYAGQFNQLAQQSLAAGQPTDQQLAAWASRSGNGAYQDANTLNQLGSTAAQAGVAYNPALANLAGGLAGAGGQFLNQQAPTFNPEEQRLLLLQATDRAGELAGLEREQGPSAAQAQLNMATNQSMQNNLALARSGSGFGENAQLLSQAINQNALAGQDAANQSAILKAQEDAQWRERQAGNLGRAAELGLGGAQQYGQQTQFGASLEQQQLAQNQAGYLQALAQSGQITQQQADNLMRGLGQQSDIAGQAAQLKLSGYGQAADINQLLGQNEMQRLGLAGDLTGQASQAYLDAQARAAQTQLGAAQFGAQLGQDAISQAGNLALQAQAQQGQLGLEGLLGAAGVRQTGFDQSLAAVQGGIQAGQAGTQLGADIYGQGADLRMAGNEMGLQALDRYLAAGGLQQQGYQTADQLLNTTLASQAQAAGIQQASYQQALDAYNQSVANAQEWEQLGLTQEQAETARQQNYFELLGAIANAVGEAIPG